jgi:hypothetical protein
MMRGLRWYLTLRPASAIFISKLMTMHSYEKQFGAEEMRRARAWCKEVYR